MIDDQPDGRTPAQGGMIDKIAHILQGEAKGERLDLKPDETEAFRLMMLAMHRAQLWSDMKLIALSDALIRDGLEVVHQEHDDGSVTYHLVHKLEAPAPSETAH